jgi:histidinol phosphatase-like PHP family hydrolase
MLSVEEFAAFFKSYAAVPVTPNRCDAEIVGQMFRKRGIEYRPTDQSKSDIYLAALPIINSGLVDLIDNKQLLNQLTCLLERRTARGGKDSLDHPPNAHDDLANAVAGALITANRSDGADTLEVMAEAALARGYEYFGITDHSQSAHYAGGLSTEQIEEQQREIARLNRTYGGRFRLFKGIESDIRADGSLDYPDEVLGTFDFVVASVHGRFKLSREAQTERVLRAIANPYPTILGHMTGRQLLRRPGYEIDIPRVLARAAAHGVAVEINANPWRLDLGWRWHQEALRLGCMMSINPDAHSTDEIDLTHWGVEIARKGWRPERTSTELPVEQGTSGAICTSLGARRSDSNGARVVGNGRREMR